MITKAVYGHHKALKKMDEPVEANNKSDSQIIDVTLPLNFLVNESGQLKVYILFLPYYFLTLYFHQFLLPMPRKKL